MTELDRIDHDWLRRFRRRLVAWYTTHARDLPWRRSTDPYRIWISEIMLQQTTVATVIPYFERFMNRFSTLAELAAAPEDDVLRLWEGLGYYSRARNIHKAAQILVAEHAGRFPESVEQLTALPGIGRYTAGAIASFAYDRRAPIVEANTLRLYSRLLGYTGDPRSTAGQKLLWEFAERILPIRAPGRFNQALMEVGSVVCTPTEPDCPHCPVSSCCAAFLQGAQSQIPQPKQRPTITSVTEATVAVRRGDAVVLYRRQPGERWAGLWDFPRFELGEEHVPSPERSRKSSKVENRLSQHLEREIAVRCGILARIDHQLAEIKHSVTRYRIRLCCFQAVFESGELQGSHEEIRWVDVDELSGYPLSMTGRKFARLLLNNR